jgi:hypothetical protein
MGWLTYKTTCLAEPNLSLNCRFKSNVGRWLLVTGHWLGKGVAVKPALARSITCLFVQPEASDKKPGAVKA